MINDFCEYDINDDGEFLPNGIGLRKKRSDSYEDEGIADEDLYFEEDYEESLGIKLFTIKVSQTPDAINVTDMRQLGGGLVEDEPDNYNLMDIGHANGRPYRKAGTLVFTMPTKYKEYEDVILKAVNKYISASDIPVILFEDKNK